MKRRRIAPWSARCGSRAISSPMANGSHSCATAAMRAPNCGCPTAGPRSRPKAGRRPDIGARSMDAGTCFTLGGLSPVERGTAGLPRELLRGRRVRALGRQASAERSRMGSRGACRRAGGRLRRRLAMDAQRLFVRIRATGRSPARSANTMASSWSTRWCCAARRWRPRRARARELPQFLLSRRPLAVHRAAARRLSRPELPSFRQSRRSEKAHEHRCPQAARARASATPSAHLPTTCWQGSRPIPKRLPPKYFYDQRGSELFERITSLARILSDPHRDRHPGSQCGRRSRS